MEDDAAEWVIEVSFDPGVHRLEQAGETAWALSRLNGNVEAHTLEWCMERWRAFKANEMRLGASLLPFAKIPGNMAHDAFPGMTTKPYRYRMRNIRTEDIIMGAIL